MEILVATIFIIVCVLLIVVVLLQKGRGGGLSAAFGGMGSSAFGTRTGDVFTWITIALTAVFLLFAVFASLKFHQDMDPLPAPKFYPEGLKEISKTTRISIRVERVPGAEIYYTVDGSTPTKASIKHDVTSVPVKPGTTIKARAYMRGWLPSPVATRTYARAGAPGSAPAPSVTPPAAAPAATAPATPTAPAG